MKAVIESGGKQYIVQEGDLLDIELLTNKKNNISFKPLMLIDGKSSKVGAPTVEGAEVKAELVGTAKSKKVTVVKFQAKKRVHSKRGHRQQYNTVRITSILAK